MLGKLLHAANAPRKWLHAFLGLGRPHPPREVSMGLLMGWLIGFGPWGLHTAVPVMLLLLTRCFWPMAIAGIVGGVVVWPMAAGYTEELGYSLLSADGMVAGWVRWACEAPVLAWMGLNEYRMVGAMALGIAIGGGASLALRLLLGVLYKFGIGRIGPWVFSKVAKATGAGPDEEEALKETFWTKGPFRIIRPTGLITVPLIGLLFAWAGSGAAGAVLKHQITAQLASHLGTKVTLEGVSLSFSEGAVELTGFTVWDPAEPERHILKAASLRLNVDGGGLLSGRLHAEEAVVRGVEFRFARRGDGSSNLDGLAPYRGGAGTSGSSGGGAKGLLDWAKGKAADAVDHEAVDWAELVDRLKPYLESRPAKELSEEEAHAAEFPPPGSGGEDGAAWNVPWSAPRWVVGRAALEECRIDYSAGPKPLAVEQLSGEIRNWSSDAALHGKPVEFALSGTLGPLPVTVRGTKKPPAEGGGLSLSLK